MARTRGRGNRRGGVAGRGGRGRGGPRGGGADSSPKHMEVLTQDAGPDVNAMLENLEGRFRVDIDIPCQPETVSGNLDDEEEYVHDVEADNDMEEPQPGPSHQYQNIDAECKAEPEECKAEPEEKDQPPAKRRRIQESTIESIKSRRTRGTRFRVFRPGVFSRAWSLADKQLLLEALQLHGTSNAEKIQKAVPNKSLIEVKEMLYKLSQQAKRKSRQTDTVPFHSTAAIEGWLDMCVSLAQTVPDYSWTISKVMSMLKTLEKHDESVTESMPRYDHIYAYLQNLLSPTPTANMPQLSLVEAGVVLDLLEDLTQSLKRMLTQEQRELMHWKALELLSIAKVQAPAGYSIAHTWRAMLQTFPSMATLEATKEKVLSDQVDQERASTSASSTPARPSTSQSTNPQPSTSRSTSHNLDKEVASITRRIIQESRSAAAAQSTNQTAALFESTSQNAASFKPTNQSAASKQTDSSDPMEKHDVSSAQSKPLNPEDEDNEDDEEEEEEEEEENSNKDVELHGCKIDVDMKESGPVSLFSINPFVIPVNYLKPFNTNPEPISRLDSSSLDKILVRERTKKIRKVDHTYVRGPSNE